MEHGLEWSAAATTATSWLFTRRTCCPCVSLGRMMVHKEYPIQYTLLTHSLQPSYVFWGKRLEARAVCTALLLLSSRLSQNCSNFFPLQIFQGQTTGKFFDWIQSYAGIAHAFSPTKYTFMASQMEFWTGVV